MAPTPASTNSFPKWGIYAIVGIALALLAFVAVFVSLRSQTHSKASKSRRSLRDSEEVLEPSSVGAENDDSNPRAKDSRPENWAKVGTAKQRSEIARAIVEEWNRDHKRPLTDRERQALCFLENKRSERQELRNLLRNGGRVNPTMVESFIETECR
jgi:hypothetical protein